MVGEIFFLNQIAELGKLSVPEQFDGAGRAVALLADDDFAEIGGFADAFLSFFHAVLQMLRRFARALFGFFVLYIIVFAENKHDDIGILFD